MIDISKKSGAPISRAPLRHFYKTELEYFTKAFCAFALLFSAVALAMVYALCYDTTCHCKDK